jgi:esterase/lipase superfamily enzyme
MSILRLALLVAPLACAGCEPRGYLTMDPSAAGVGQVHELLVATSRRPTPGYEIFGRERSAELAYARFAVSVPPNRAPGTVTFPDALPGDPRTDFLTVSATRIDGAGGFLAAVEAALRARPPGQRRVVVFAHGYNNTFPEGLYRQAQMLHDFGTPAVAVHYAWPSAANPRLYLYDRDSAFFARDGLDSLLRTLGRSQADRIVVVGHSMGAQVVVEALRQMALTGAPGFFDKLYAVVLMAPDVDVDLFHSEVRPLARMDIPWFIFISSRDRALRMSSFARGQRERLGSLSDLRGVADLDVTVIDLSGVDSVDPLGHQTVAESPVMISLIRGLGAYGPEILADEDRDFGIVETTVRAVEEATSVVIQPLAQ